jgi:hypothetical protein
VADGKAVDTPAVNRAIAAAAAAGGGTVQFPAGTYACHSIRLRSFVTLYVEPGAIILAAPAFGYDTAEPNGAFERYQDFGHNHWHNSLIWGEDLRDVAIVGLGLICGRGLSRGEAAEPGLPPADAPGAADKAIAFKRCRNVTVRGIAILAAGHFGILATGVENLTLEDLKIDTNRDGINVDCCRNVRISGCRVNSPWDDGICLKSSFALGEVRATENVTISNCYVTGGFALGTMLDAPSGESMPMPGNQRAGSNAAPNRTAASKTSPSATASSKAVVALRSRAWTHSRALAKQWTRCPGLRSSHHRCPDRCSCAAGHTGRTLAGPRSRQGPQQQGGTRAFAQQLGLRSSWIAFPVRMRMTNSLAEVSL